MIAVAAASGAMAVTIPAYAGVADVAAAGLPGVISGNTVQPPVHVPVDVCGNTVNVVGLLNPAAGISCANEDVRADVRAVGGADAAETPGRAIANGAVKDSPGVLSGNGAQLPVHLPVNVIGNSVSVVGVDNTAVGNESNTPGDLPETPDLPESPVLPEQRTPKLPPPPEVDPGLEAAPSVPQPHFTAELADTGTDQILPALGGSAALILGGAVVYRRCRPRVMR
ncbi:chaplin family protein [Streptomyces sp. MMG1533]|uniref:chaplin family protein n=1 Tax=Streptomyces sp. MMG1533 TaxID=1415546 RepID=UPI002D21B842|nr:chaplin family protein [Streptomyces sp. MMG1533]